MTQAVIVSTARTPIGRAYRGALNDIRSPTLMAHSIRHAVARAGVDPAEIDDVVIGTVLSGGSAGMNLARNALLAAGLPVTVSGQTLDRQCSSGLMAIATAAKQIAIDGMSVVVAGGQDNISALQTPYMEWAGREKDENVIAAAPSAYMPMLQTAEFVAKKYSISREAQDEYSLESQRRTAQAQQAGRFDAEIVPITATMALKDKETGAISHKTVTLAKDEGNRPDTTLAGLAALKPVIDGGVSSPQATRASSPTVPRRACSCTKSSPRNAASRRSAVTSASRLPAAHPRRWASGRSTRFRNC